MNRFERMKKVWACESADRVPFLPAIYEYKAFLIDRTPSEVATDAELFYQAMMVEYERLEADAMVVGMDVYNIEAEALGSRVTYYPNDTSIPGIGADGHALSFGQDFSHWRIPNPLRDGRMPVQLEVARRLAPLALEVPVRGAVTGPFSLALNLVGSEAFFLGTLDDPDSCRRILDFCAEVIIEFGKAYLDAGVGVIMFDSQASPDLLPPEMYADLVFPPTRRCLRRLHELGDRFCPLIIGGNTTPILDTMIATGTRQVLCDFTADWNVFRSICETTNVSVRRNMSPIDVQQGDRDKLTQIARQMLAESAGTPGFILGTAVVPYGTRLENLLAIRDVVWGGVR